jgi:hypothetical protein
MDPARASESGMTTRTVMPVSVACLRFMVLAIAMLIILPGCSTAEDTSASDASRCAANFAAEFAAAEQLRVAAANAGAEWIETAGLLNSAKHDAEAGSMDTACALLDQAVFQARTALAQAQREADTWRNRVVR